MKMLLMSSIRSTPLVRLLEDEGHLLDHVEDLAAAGAALANSLYDAIIIDLAGSDWIGDEIVRAIRRIDGEMRILMIGRGDNTDCRVAALNEGADDFLQRPFVTDEFIARLRALLRRPPHIVLPVLQLGDIALQTLTGVVRIGGIEVRMPRRQFSILELLLKYQHRFVSRERLDQAIFSFESTVTPNALEAAVSRLRQTLAANRSAFTVAARRNIGYALVRRKTDADIGGAAEAPRARSVLSILNEPAHSAPE